MLNEGEHANERDFGSYPLPYSVERHRLSAKEFFLNKRTVELCSCRRGKKTRKGKHKRGRRLLNAHLNKVPIKGENWFFWFWLEKS